MSGQDRPDRKTRADFAHFRSITTRWADNDVYGHVNNVVYYSFFDTVAAGYHVETGLLDVERSPVIGLVVETGCRYFASIAFPDRVEAGLRVAHLGRSSVRYEIGIFRGDDDEVSAQGHFVHVHVDRETRRPVPLPDDWRERLASLVMSGREGTEAARSP
ncbi:acyl-CoA thioesterase [Methylobacterium brachythecii]|uniref:Acyl-CoA thioester hydrolase n=1 Tax=Methylobacterium brachythecii TaxID=1176177 RepID=A0A7W6AIN0_9HYPH|nr:thioesterase family protein [Methylobacterium brachythecii]MBB3903418.1 acyl-CoA thioester hydrolase [Methylobacterium brachythecii]GLS45499.1 thioesterase [Methylobacterium brachythecii]